MHISMQAVADCTVTDAPVLDVEVVRRYSDWGRGGRCRGVPILPVTGRSVWDCAVEDWAMGCGLWRMGPWGMGPWKMTSPCRMRLKSHQSGHAPGQPPLPLWRHSMR